MTETRQTFAIPDGFEAVRDEQGRATGEVRPAIPPVEPQGAQGVERQERDEARLLVAEANNSLYGSQGYFHSLNGGPFDKYHLATGIEKLKAQSRKEWRRAEAAEARIATLMQALEPFADACRMIAEDHSDDYAPEWSPFLTAGTYRRARTVLSSMKEPKNG